MAKTGIGSIGSPPSDEAILKALTMVNDTLRLILSELKAQRPTVITAPR